ncbi:predicted protein [Naegleria gruberi]|uniref:Predicted protein n=1 Tax=Naegleria gruberi TaxID=5762 RepID=D2W5D0_NAEGR|nr:uncharacterized protein NAEGRDRAFT_76620 [Naegleria gruberi]EFC35723.1 predicted protein [Naegleria gruberi]|eukprot:XP_002668467.1 predicted protein [Naegleria gruberi strain NEG-M]
MHSVGKIAELALLVNYQVNETSSTNNVSSPVFTIDDFDDTLLSAIDQSISFLFILLFISLILVMIIFIVRNQTWKTLRKAQRIVLILVNTLLIVQTLALCARTAYTFCNISIVERFHNYLKVNNVNEPDQLYQDVMINRNSTLTTETVGIPYADLVGLFFALGIETFLILIALLVINEIVHYISHLFFNLIKYSQGILKSKQTKIIRKIFDTSFFISSAMYFLLVVAVFVMLVIESLKVTVDILFIFSIACFAFFAIQLIVQTIAISIVFSRVIILLNKTRKQFKDQSQSYSWKQPILKIIILLSVLIFSTFFQIIAVGLGAVSFVWNYSSLFYDFLNCLGILIFSILVMCLYHPSFDFFNRNQSEQDTTTTNTNTTNTYTTDTQTTFEDRYISKEFIATGGFGTVYKVTTKNYEKLALKLGKQTSEVMISVREYQKMRQITHCNIIKTCDLFMIGDGIVGIEMELMKMSLKNVMTTEKPFSEKIMQTILVQMCSALEILKVCNLIHRDIKPDNILIRDLDLEREEVSVVLSDFGLARNLDTFTSTGISGTVNFIAPEKEGLELLPENLLEAIKEFEKDPLMKEVFLEHNFNMFKMAKRAEWDKYVHHCVTDWEFERYSNFM